VNPAEIIEKRGSNAGEAAVELVRRYLDTERMDEAARLWCDRFGGKNYDFGRGGGEPHSTARCVYELLAVAARDHVLLGKWVLRCRDAESTKRNGPGGEAYRSHLLSALIKLWPSRDRGEQYPDVLREWAAAQSNYLDVVEVAEEFWDCPGLAYGMLGPIWYVAPHGSCYGCAQHHRDPRDSGFGHLRVLARRRLERAVPVPEDDYVLQALPRHALLREPLLRLTLHAWLREGSEGPTELWEAVHQALQIGSPDSSNALAFLLCGPPEKQDLGLSFFLLSIRGSAEPANAFGFGGFEGRIHLLGVFTGPGWGRARRPRRLLEISRALLERGVWPMKAWVDYVDEQRHDPDSPEAERLEKRFEFVREILAEGLLSFAVDEQAPEEQRRRALDAIERLQPGGDGSWLRALPKVQSPPSLKSRARDVQRNVAAARGRPTDAELAIEDATEAFFGAATSRSDAGEGGNQ